MPTRASMVFCRPVPRIECRVSASRDRFVMHRVSTSVGIQRRRVIRVLDTENAEGPTCPPAQYSWHDG